MEVRWSIPAAEDLERICDGSNATTPKQPAALLEPYTTDVPA
jgi:hypothetical protein